MPRVCSTAVGSPTDTEPVGAPLAAATSSSALCICRTIVCACRYSSRPASVSSTPFGRRMNSRARSSCSSADTWWLTADCAIDSWPAAFEMLPRSATLRK